MAFVLVCSGVGSVGEGLGEAQECLLVGGAVVVVVVAAAAQIMTSHLAEILPNFGDLNIEEISMKMPTIYGGRFNLR